MRNIHKVLVAYDGSNDSKTSLDYAIHMAKLTGASLDIVKVFEPYAGTFLWPDGQSINLMLEKFKAEKENDQKLVETACEHCRNMGVEVHSALLVGFVTASLLDYAQTHNIDLIVAGNKGHGIFREVVTGSTTSSLIELSPIPVLVVKEKNVVGDLKKLLLAYDGSRPGKNAFNWAANFCKENGTELVAATVSDPSSLAMIYAMSGVESAESFSGKVADWVEEGQQILSEIAELGRAAGVNVAAEVLQGNTIDAIIKYGKQNNADLFVVGSKGRGTFEALLLGSVARGLVHLSPIPVMVVK